MEGEPSAPPPPRPAPLSLHVDGVKVHMYYTSLIPRPFRKRKGLVHIASACARGPQKKLGESDTIVYSPFIVHRTARHAKSASNHHGNVTGHYGDTSACTHNVYQAPPEGPGYETTADFRLVDRRTLNPHAHYYPSIFLFLLTLHYVYPYKPAQKVQSSHMRKRIIGQRT